MMPQAPHNTGNYLLYRFQVSPVPKTAFVNERERQTDRQTETD